MIEKVFDPIESTFKIIELANEIIPWICLGLIILASYYVYRRSRQPEARNMFCAVCAFLLVKLLEIGFLYLPIDLTLWVFAVWKLMVFVRWVAALVFAWQFLLYAAHILDVNHPILPKRNQVK